MNIFRLNILFYALVVEKDYWMLVKKKKSFFTSIEISNCIHFCTKSIVGTSFKTDFNYVYYRLWIKQFLTHCQILKMVCRMSLWSSPLDNLNVVQLITTQQFNYRGDGLSSSVWLTYSSSSSTYYYELFLFFLFNRFLLLLFL